MKNLVKNGKNKSYKICLVFNRLDASNGVARAAIAVAGTLQSHGYDVTLIPLYKCDSSYIDYIPNGIRVSTFLNFYFPGLAKILNFVPAVLLYKLIIREQYDLEIAFQRGQGARILSKSTNLKAGHLVWMHGYDENILQYAYCFDKVISVSQSNMVKLLAESNGSLNVDVCYNTIDDTLVRILGNENIDVKIDSNTTTFVSVGRLSKEKGYMRLPSCVNKLKESGYIFKVLIVGDGPEMEMLNKEITALDLNNYFILLGTQSNPHKFTSKCDVFLCPSYTEGYSNSCTEAIMLGIPVISTDVSGAAEIINESEAGMVVDNTEDGIIKGMRSVLDSPKIISEWKSKIKKTKIRFSKESRTSKLLSIVEEAINK